MASRKGSSAEATAAEQPIDVADFFDPVYEWLNGGANYLLRLNLPGFKKEDFRVHVEPTGRLTIRGQRPADGGAGSVRLHKVFQLPPTSNLDGIAGRFDGGVLTLIVPKLPPGEVAPPQDTEEEEEAPKATPSEKAAKRENQDGKAKAEAERKAKVGREAGLRIEAARESLAEAERAKGRWKERAAEEGFKWADTIGKKEVIATAVAAFTLGVIASRKLFSRS